jgi:hypothetical protein
VHGRLETAAKKRKIKLSQEIEKPAFQLIPT